VVVQYWQTERKNQGEPTNEVQPKKKKLHDWAQFNLICGLSLISPQTEASETMHR